MEESFTEKKSIGGAGFSDWQKNYKKKYIYILKTMCITKICLHHKTLKNPYTKPFSLKTAAWLLRWDRGFYEIFLLFYCDLREGFN